MFVPSRRSCVNNALAHISKVPWVSCFPYLLLDHVMVEHASLSSCFRPTCLLRVGVYECCHLIIFNDSIQVNHGSVLCWPERIKEICYWINRGDSCDSFRRFNATRSVSNSSSCQQSKPSSCWTSTDDETRCVNSVICSLGKLVCEKKIDGSFAVR